MRALPAIEPVERAPAPSRVAVVGSGVSGLAAAFQLYRAGCEVELLERERTPGGRFGLDLLGERDVMLGGKNIGRRYSSFRGFTAALAGARYEPFGINASRVLDGRLKTLDSSRRGRSAANVLGAGAPRDLARLAKIAVAVRGHEANRYLGSPLAATLGARYDHAPIAAHFGARLTSNLLRPMGIRTNGAEPGELYLGAFATNIGMLMDTYDQLSAGIGPVIERLMERIPIQLDQRVEAVRLRRGRAPALEVSEQGGPARERTYDAIVLATPAHAAASLLQEDQPALASTLERIRYLPGTVALVEYDRAVLSPEVRAIAFAQGPCSNAGAYGVQDRHIVRYTFSGPEARLGQAPGTMQLDDWITQAEERLNHHLPLLGARRVQSVSRHWDAAYCAYTPFHSDFLTDLSAASAPGLALAGDYLRGSSIEGCFRAGTEAAHAITRQLETTARQ